MLIRITGGSAGIAEYLENGQKQDRESTRTELDERVILDGDLELTDTIIKGMEKEGERYLHITIAFKEDSLDIETLKGIASDFKQFAMSAYDSDEFNFYAEAHLPKIKSYINRRTGELIERKPHIHIVIPEKNLLSRQNLNPFGRVEQQVKFLEAFQEHTNSKYGIASPKDNRRLEFTSESEMISRYKGDLFQGKTKELKERILSELLDRKINNYESFKTLLAEHGAARSRNPGTDQEYQNIKPADQLKGVNLKDYVFSREFIEKSDAEKQRVLSEEGRMKYESQQAGRVSDPELAARLQEWHEVRAPELKYINSGSRKLYAAYRNAERHDKQVILAERAERFYAKYQAIRAQGIFKTVNEKELSNERPDYKQNTTDQYRAESRAALHQSNLEKSRRAAPPGNIASVRNLSSVGMVQHQRRTQMLLQPNALDRMGRERSADIEVRWAGIGDSRAPEQERVAGGRGSDNVVGQFAADHNESKAQTQGARVAEFSQIKRDLDARRLLSHLSKTHGVITDKYEVTRAKDGSDRIKAGGRNLNVSDFLTQEMRLSFNEAAPILRTVYAAQIGRNVSEARPGPSKDLWSAYRKTQAKQAGEKARQWDAQRMNERERRTKIRTSYQAERSAIGGDKSKSPSKRKAALSIASMERVNADLALRAAVNIERGQLREKHGQSQQVRYRSFLKERAGQGDEFALNELRRQRDTAEEPVGINTIEGSTAAHRYGQGASIARSLAYSVDYDGNVTYYADATKRRALIVDSGKAVTVAAVNDRHAVEAGLRLATQKFGQNLKITGGSEFKRQVIEAALKTGLHVEFDDQRVNDEFMRRRAEREDLQARGVAFVTAEREKVVFDATKQFTKQTEVVTENKTDQDIPKRERDIEW